VPVVKKVPRANAKKKAKTTSSTMPPLYRIIAADIDVAEGVQALRKACTHMCKAHDLVGQPPLRRRAPGFEGLARIIVGQQLSIASANAIWTRFAATVKPMTARTLSRCTDEDLRSAGLSRPKIRTLRAMSEAVVGGLNLEQLDGLTNEDVHAALTAVSGIGPWTADVFLMFNLGRADAFAEGDLALQVAAQMLLGLEERPKPAELTLIAERWRPWRGVAARMLWAYYAVAKTPKAGAMPV
jgi:DNA-3-methyladenine glycosylase II